MHNGDEQDGPALTGVITSVQILAHTGTASTQPHRSPRQIPLTYELQRFPNMHNGDAQDDGPHRCHHLCPNIYILPRY